MYIITLKLSEYITSRRKMKKIISGLLETKCLYNK
jgi:hypothetical protein